MITIIEPNVTEISRMASIGRKILSGANRAHPLFPLPEIAMPAYFMPV